MAGADDFYRLFPGLSERLRGRRALDFGCGYGGKTLAYAKDSGSVAGIEPFPQMIEFAERARKAWGVKNAEFKVCTQAEIPYADASFDIVVSHDVLEHVDNPQQSMAEIARVLKPGGEAFIVCPVYDGAVSHHLDYVSRLPGLHWLFPPTVLVRAVNRLLGSGRFNTNPQPEPGWDWTGARRVLPGLNGLTGAQMGELTTGFSTAAISHRMLGQSRAPWLASLFRLAGNLSPLLRDRLTGSLVIHLVR